MFLLLLVFLCHCAGSGRHRPPGRTFFSGEVGVITWFVGLVGGDTVMLVEVAVVLLLTDAEGLLLSGGGVQKRRQCSKTITETRFHP